MTAPALVVPRQTDTKVKGRRRRKTPWVIAAVVVLVAAGVAVVTVVVPVLAWAGGIGAALVIGAVAGLLPALRAARMSPTEALWTV